MNDFDLCFQATQTEPFGLVKKPKSGIFREGQGFQFFPTASIPLAWDLETASVFTYEIQTIA